MTGETITAGKKARCGAMGADMNMVDLILTVCLSANPTHCRDEHLYFESGGTLNQCMFLAQPEIAKWVEQHPTLKVVRWRCAYPDREKSI